MPDLFLTCAQYDVLEKPNGDCFIKDKRRGKFFFKKACYFSRRYQTCPRQVLERDARDLAFSLLMVLSWCALAGMFQRYDAFSRSAGSGYVIVAYLLLNVVLHEAGHILTLRLWGMKAGKIRLTFFLMFPTVKVDTSDVYLLPAWRGACVCYAGVMVNIYICFITMLLFPEYGFAIPPVLIMIVSNLLPLPLVKTDGYNILMHAILKFYDRKHARNLYLILTETLFLCAIFFWWLTLLYQYFYIDA